MIRRNWIAAALVAVMALASSVDAVTPLSDRTPAPGHYRQHHPHKRHRYRRHHRGPTHTATPTPTPTTTWTPTVTPTPRPWSTPVTLSPESGAYPDVAADATGGVHVVWQAGDSRYDKVMSCQVGTDGCSDTTAIAHHAMTAGGSYPTRPSLAVGADGTLHVIWRSKFQIAYQKVSLADPRRGWSVPYRLGEGSYSTIAAGPDGVVHAAWSQSQYGDRSNPCNGCADVMYARSEDGAETWTAMVDLSRTAAGSEKPQFAFGNDGTIYLVWEEGRDKVTGKGTPMPAMGIVSRDGGKTWGTPFSFSAAEAAENPAVAVAGDGTAVVVWRAMLRDELVYQTSTDRGRTWSEPRIIMPGLHRRWRAPDESDGAQMTTDAAGTVHLVMTGLVDERMELSGVYHASFDGASWTMEEIARTTGAPEWPRIAVSDGNTLNVVWFDQSRDQLYTGKASGHRIYYARATSDAPSVARVAWPASSRWVDWREVWRLTQIIAAVAIVTSVILWARRRGL